MEEKNKMVWKKVLKKIVKFLLVQSFNLLWSAIDKNKDGKVSKQELKEFNALIKKKLAKFK